MAYESPVIIQCEGSWVVLSGCGEVTILGNYFEDAFNKSFSKSNN